MEVDGVVVGEALRCRRQTRRRWESHGRIAQTRTEDCRPWQAEEEEDERWLTGDQTELIDTIKKNRLKPRFH
jgi:hypothetical protein